MIWVLAVLAAVAAIGMALVWLRRRRLRRTPADPYQMVLEISELAGGLAHEIRNPLSTLLLNLKLLSEDLEEASDVDRDVQRRCLSRIGAIQDEARRLEQLLSDFLHLAGPCKLDRRPVDLNETVRHLVRFFGPQAEASGIRVLAADAPQPVMAAVDVPLIEQAILNLLINAQQAMPSGGELIIRCAADAPGRVSIEVCDTGTGIPPDVADKIFRPFYSTKAKGTGLGLSTTQRIVAEHGGSIHVDSEPSKGTRFVIRLPAAKERAS